MGVAIVCAAIGLATTAAAGTFRADVSLRVAVPDGVVGKSDGVRVTIAAVSSVGEQRVARRDVIGRGWHVVGGECELPAGEPYRIRVTVGPRHTPAYDVLGFHSLVVRPAGGKYARNLLAMASLPRVMSKGRMMPARAEFRGGRVRIEDQQRTPWLLVHEPFGGRRWDVVVDFEGAPFFPGLVNHCRNAVVRASTWAEPHEAKGACDGRFDLAGEAFWVDNTPDDYPDVLEAHFPCARPVTVKHVLVFMHPGMMREAMLKGAELWGLDGRGWRCLGRASKLALPYVHWRLSPARELYAVRIVCLGSRSELSRVLELEAWGDAQRAERFDPDRLLELKVPTGPVKPDAAGGGVVASAGDGPLRARLRARLETRGGREVGVREYPVSLGPGQRRAVAVRFGGVDGGVYRLRVSLVNGEHVLAERCATVAVRGVSGSRGTEGRLNVSGIDPRRGIVSITGRMAGGAPVGRVRLALARDAGCDLVTAWTGLKDLEPYEGCIDLSALQPLVERAQEYGRGIELLVMMNDGQVPEWLRGHEIRDSLGRAIALHAGRGEGGRTPSYWSAKFREHWQRLVREIVSRYAAEETIRIWHFRPGDLDVFFHDIPAQRRVYDYSRFARAMFRQYLRKVRGYSLQEVNRRYGLTLSDWDELQPPEPRFEADVDLRPAWADFVDFKQWTIRELLELTFKTVRGVDRVRPMAQWALGGSGALDDVLEVCAKHGVLASFNSIEHPYNAIWLDLARRHGTWVRTETGGCPPRPENFGQSMFFALAGGANMYVWVGRVRDDNPAWNIFCRSGEMFRALSGAEAAPTPVAAVFGYTYYRQKSFQWTVFARYMKPEVRLLLDAERRGLVELDWYSDYSPLQGLARYRLVIESGSPILPQQAIDALATYVRSGGTLLLMAESGRYRRADASVKNPLLTALHYPGPRDDERAALERWRYGRGTVIRVPRSVKEQSEMDTLLAEVLGELGIRRQVLAPEGVWVSRIVKGGRVWVLVFNATDEARRAEVNVWGVGEGASLWPLGEQRREVGGQPMGNGYVRFAVPLRARGLAALAVAERRAG